MKLSLICWARSSASIRDTRLWMPPVQNAPPWRSTFPERAGTEHGPQSTDTAPAVIPGKTFSKL